MKTTCDTCEGFGKVRMPAEYLDHQTISDDFPERILVQESYWRQCPTCRGTGTHNGGTTQ